MINKIALEEILISHYKKYPCMQIKDMVKLIYQNEFAGGHLISNEAESLARLKAEWDRGTGTLSQGTERDRGTGTLSQGTERDRGIGTLSQGTERDRGTGTLSQGTERDRGTGTLSQGTERDSGTGDLSRGTEQDRETGILFRKIDAGTEPVRPVVHYKYENCVNSSCDELLFEEIGNGLCRLNLRGLADSFVNLETINRFFIYTSRAVKGTVQAFEEKLKVLLDCCEKGILPFTRDEAEEYISAYKKQGYPPVSHSGRYREMYHPAYRIVLSDFCRYFQIFCRIDELIKKAESSQYPKDYITVAVEGGSCSGKSTLAALLNEVYDCNVFHMDDFFLTPELRTEERLRETGGNVDYVRFRDEVISGIESRHSFEYRIYDCSTKSMHQTVNVTPKKLNIVEGVYSMHPKLSANYDLKIFLNIEKGEQSRRILKRNGPAMHKRFMEEWVPKENAYFEKFSIASKCDLLFM